MSDATYIELPAQPKKRPSFLRSWRGAVLLLFLLAVAVAAWFSWWLSEGKVSSAMAQVDTIVYAVEPNYPARVEQILVQQGQEVQEGQPLAMVNTIQAQPASAQPAQPDENAEIGSRVRASAEKEKNMSNRASQARSEEERFQKIHQDRVAEHVRAQLMLRSVDRGDYAAYNQASQMEASARARMNSAREQFESVSQMRAAVDTELGKIRSEGSRRRVRRAPAQETQQASQPAAVQVLETLYAPVNGTVMDINVRPGQVLQNGESAFLILPASNGNMDTWIQAWFPLSARQMLKPGQKAQIKSGDLHLNGQISVVGTEPQYMPADGTGRQFAQYLPVRIQVDNPQELAKLAPGASVECQVQTRYVINAGLF